MTLKAKARVVVNLEFVLPGTWSPDTKIEQLYDQAKTEAIQRLTKDLPTKKYKLLTVPTVQAVLFDE